MSLAWTFAAAADCPTLGELNRQLLLDEGQSQPRSPEELAERMRGWLAAGEYEAVLFREQGEVVAYAVFRETADEVYLRQFFVVRGRRREGLGRRAWEILRAQVWPRDKRLTVTALTANAAAVAFWRAVGCREFSLTFELLPGGAGPGATSASRSGISPAA